MFKIEKKIVAGALLAALIAGPGFAEIKQLRLGVKGAT
jgi:hypothetical protein